MLGMDTLYRIPLPFPVLGGFGLVTIPTVSTGITAIRIIQTGEGYVSTALPVIKCAGNSDLVTIPTLGAVTKVIVQKIGSGYTADPLYTIKCAGGKDLNAVPNIGAVTAINIDRRAQATRQMLFQRLNVQVATPL